MMLDDNIQDPWLKKIVAYLTRFIKDIVDQNDHIFLGLEANEVLEPLGVPVKTTSINVLQRECRIQDIYKYQHETLGDTTNKK